MVQGKFLLCFIILLSLYKSIDTSRLRSSKEESKDEVFESIFTSDKSTSSKKTRVPTRWPLMDTWITDHVAKASNVQGKSDSSQLSSHPPLAENIKCSTKGHSQSFTAVISQPFGFGNVPLFEDAVNTLNPVTSEECQMKPSGGTFLMKINDFAKCGVTSQKGSDGKEWLTVSIVFPYVGGLRTSDDEHVMIMCKPQERIATKSHIIDYRPNMPSGPKAIYQSPNHELDTKILMFTRKGSSSTFTEELTRNALIEVGQDLQFRAVVRPGDGWKYAKLKDLTIQRSSNNNEKGKNSNNNNNNNNNNSNKINPGDTAYLVMEDGCRNPVYVAIAPKHPSVDPSNPLVVNFVFKAFMFQDMADGDTLRISAKIVACQEQSDCQPGICVDDDLPGNGRRKRSLLPSQTFKSSVNDLVKEKDNSSNCIHDWTRDFEFNVVMPGYSKNRIESMNADSIRIVHTDDSRCRNVIFATALVSMVLVVTTAVISIVSLRSKQSIIDKYTSNASSASESVNSFEPCSTNRKESTTPVLIGSSFLKSSVRGLHTRIHNTSM